MTKLLGKTLLLFPIPLLVFAITWTVDPAHIRDSTYEAGIASILLSGKNVANVANYNERILQRKFVFGITKAPEVLVLGSSRSMGIDSSFFPSRSLLNSSVSGASIGDYLGVFDLYRRRGLKPKLVVIGCDPWVLNRNNGQDRWKYIESEYLEMRSILGSPSAHRSTINGQFKEFLSPAYFQQSLYDLVMGRSTTKYWATDQFQSDEPVKIFDGSLVYGKDFRNKTTKDINSDATAYAMAKPLYSLGKFHELDQSTMHLLDKFIDYLELNKVKVVIFLPPYHPIAYEAIRANAIYRKVIEAERWYRSLADKYGINVIGSYDPKLYGLDASDFYDGMHPKSKALHKIFDSNNFL